MKLHTLSKSCLSVLAVAVAGTASAADLRINGFASFYYGNVVDNKEIRKLIGALPSVRSQNSATLEPHCTRHSV